MPCTPDEEKQCIAECASKGKEFESCRKRYRYSPGLNKLKELGLSCSCKDNCVSQSPPPSFFMIPMAGGAIGGWGLPGKPAYQP